MGLLFLHLELLLALGSLSTFFACHCLPFPLHMFSYSRQAFIHGFLYKRLESHVCKNTSTYICNVQMLSFEASAYDELLGP